MSEIFLILPKIFSIYNLFLLICTFILNPLILFICLKSKKLRSTSTFKLIAFGAINDILVCLGWNQQCFTNTYFDLQLQFKSLFYCRWISVFLQFTTLEIESWILVSISLDRLLSLSIKKWSKNYFIGKRPYIYAACLAVFIIGLNFNEVFLSGYSININGTEFVICYTTPPGVSIDWYHIMAQKNVYFGFIVPYGLLILFNSLIIYKATRFQRIHNDETSAADLNAARRKAEMTRTIVFITFLYMTLTFPSAMITGYFFYPVLFLDYGLTIIIIIDGIQFSYPALHFFILFFSNKLFAQEVKYFFFKIKEKTSSLTRSQTQTQSRNHTKTNQSSVNR